MRGGGRGGGAGGRRARRLRRGNGRHDQSWAWGAGGPRRALSSGRAAAAPHDAASLSSPDPLAAALLEAATGRPVITLDTWLLSRGACLDAFWRGARGADVALLDGGGGPLDGAVPSPRRDGPGALRPLLAGEGGRLTPREPSAAPSDGGASAAVTRTATDDAEAHDGDGDGDADGAGSDDADSDAGGGGDGSAAQAAALLGAPLLLVADGAAPGRGLVALIKGCEAMVEDVWAEGGRERRARRGARASPAPSPPSFPLAGVVLNRAPSDGASRWLATALAGARVRAPMLGALPADAAAAAARPPPPPPAAGSPAAATAAGRAAALGALVGLHLDVAAALAAAKRASPPPLAASAADAAAMPPPRPPPSQDGPKFALAYDGACFDYGPSNLAALVAAGATLVPWSPLRDDLPPGVAAALIGGGGVAASAAALASNARARAALAAFAAAGGLVVAEGDGVAVVAASLEPARRPGAGPDPSPPPLYPMAALFPFRVRERPPGARRARDAPVEAVTTGAGGLLPPGLRARGCAGRRLEILHERRLSDGVGGPATPLAGGGGEGAAGAADDTSPGWVCAFTARRAAPGAAPVAEGYVRGRALATLLRLHLESCPGLARALVAAAAATDVGAATAAARAAADAAPPPPGPRSTSADSWPLPPGGASPEPGGAGAARGLPRSASVNASPPRRAGRGVAQGDGVAGSGARSSVDAHTAARGGDRAGRRAPWGLGPSASVPDLSAWLPPGAAGSAAAPPSSDGGSERGGGGGQPAGAWLVAAARRGALSGASPPPRGSADAGGGDAWASPPGSPRGGRGPRRLHARLESDGDGSRSGAGSGAGGGDERRAPPPPPGSAAAVAAWAAAGDGVAALTPGSVDCALALGLGPRLCGVCALPRGAGGGAPPADAPRATLAPPEPGAHAPIDRAWLAAERPALVVADGGGPLAGGPCADAAGRGAAAADADAALAAAGLSAHGACVLSLAPACVADVFDGMLRLAAAAGCDPSAAAAVVGRLRSRLRLITAATASLPPPRPTVAVIARPAAPVACGGWVPELVRAAGGDPVPPLVGPGDAAALLDWGDLRKAAPDVLIIVAPRRAGGRGGAPHSVAELAVRAGWWALPAVRAGAVFVVDPALLTRPGPALVDGAAALAAALRPGAGLPLPHPGALLKLSLAGGQRCRPGLLGEYFRLWPEPQGR